MYTYFTRNQLFLFMIIYLSKFKSRGCLLTAKNGQFLIHVTIGTTLGIFLENDFLTPPCPPPPSLSILYMGLTGNVS